MIRPELVRYPSRDGRAMTGFLYLPPGASPQKPAPLVAHPHGGPTSQWLNGWHPFEQYLAQKGYALFAPNVRGSSGFGLEVENLNDKDWGKGDLEDLVAGVRVVTSRPEIRKERFGIWGVSYGGFLTLAALGRHPGLFACAVEAVGMPDLEKLYRETTTEGRTYLERELEPPGNLKLYRDLSPASLAGKMKTPLLMSPTGGDPGYAGDEFFASLREHSRRNKLGRAVGDNKAFHVGLPQRESFSPDAAFYIGPRPGMKFYEGAPAFAVEVRSENDYGPAAEKDIAAKRADYFAAGTKVVWDVDLLSDDVVRVYRATDPEHPTIYRRHETAEAEPAVSGWRMAVDDLFED